MTPEKVLLVVWALALAFYFRRELVAWIDDLVFGEDAATGNGPARPGSGESSSPMSFKEALEPIGRGPSWAEVRREK